MVVLCWGLTSQSTIFQSCRDGAIASWVINQYFRGVKCLAQGHNTAEVGLEPRTSRSGVRHSTTEPPRSPIENGKTVQKHHITHKIKAEVCFNISTSVEISINLISEKNLTLYKCSNQCDKKVPYPSLWPLFWSQLSTNIDYFRNLETLHNCTLSIQISWKSFRSNCLLKSHSQHPFSQKLCSVKQARHVFAKIKMLSSFLKFP